MMTVSEGGMNWEIGIDIYTLLDFPVATHSSILAWSIPWTEEPGKLQSMGSQRVDTTEHIHAHMQLNLIINTIIGVLVA